MNLSSSSQTKLKFALLTVGLIYVALVRLDIYQDGMKRDARLSYSANKLFEWRQPGATETQTLISNRAWRVDFTKIEKTLWPTKIDSTNNLIINSDLLERLEQTYALLPDNTSRLDLDRIMLLLQKSFPQNSGKQLADLLNKYVLYRQETDLRMTATQQAGHKEKRAMLIQSERDATRRQVNFFGTEVAQQLFSEKNSQRNYINQRQIVNMTEGLSEGEKSERLSKLQQEYKKSILKLKH